MRYNAPQELGFHDIKHAFQRAYRMSTEEMVEDLRQHFRTPETEAHMQAIGADRAAPAHTLSPEERCLAKVCTYLLSAHHDQTRKGPINQEYFQHLYMVTKQQITQAADFEDVLTALCHDGPEDGFISSPDYKRISLMDGFDKDAYEVNMRQKVRADLADIIASEGFDAERVKEQMDMLTNPHTFPHAQTKEAWQAAHFQTMPANVQNIKLSDKVANIYDSIHNTPDAFGSEKLQDLLSLTDTMLENAKAPAAYMAETYEVLKEDLSCVIEFRRLEEDARARDAHTPER